MIEILGLLLFVCEDMGQCIEIYNRGEPICCSYSVLVHALQGVSEVMDILPYWVPSKNQNIALAGQIPRWC